MNIDKSIPATNLVAHQKLLAWYTEAKKLMESQLCPLLFAVPGDWSFRTLRCDIPLTRSLYVKETGRSCHLGSSCCARVKYLEEASNELTGEPLRKDGTFFQKYGEGFGEPKYKGICVICSAGMRARCYLELGSDPKIRALIAKGARPFTETYQELAERLLLERWEKEKGP